MSAEENRKFYVSDFNNVPEVKQQMRLSPDLTLVDCTLRDGEQQAGIVFTKEDKLKIAQQLDKLGVPEIEIGMPAVSEEDLEAAKMIVAAGLKARITALARMVKSDIDMLADCGVWCATLSLPIGDLQRKYKLGWTDERYIETLREITRYAKQKGLYVNLSPYDTTRVDLDFLRRVLKIVVEDGYVDRVRLVDTVGSATPLGIKYLVEEMKKILGNIPIEIHCHDDFGMATACTLAGAEAGAEVLSTTLNGLGERAGNAPTEEVLVALKVLYGVDLGADLEKLYETARLVEELSGVQLQQHKAVVGRHAFAHESGMVVAGVLNMPFVAEAYVPELVGQKRKILIGKKSGVQSIAVRLKELGMNVPEENLKNILPYVKLEAINRKRSLTDDEFVELVKKHS